MKRQCATGQSFSFLELTLNQLYDKVKLHFCWEKKILSNTFIYNHFQKPHNRFLPMGRKKTEFYTVHTNAPVCMGPKSPYFWSGLGAYFIVKYYQKDQYSPMYVAPSSSFCTIKKSPRPSVKGSMQTSTKVRIEVGLSL